MLLTCFSLCVIIILHIWETSRPFRLSIPYMNRKIRVKSRKILKIIFGRSFPRLVVTAQKFYYGAHPLAHGSILDVLLEENGDTTQATVYDVEPDNNSGPDAVKALPRRMRFYHAKIDAHSLQAGQDYNNLKNVITIMIMPYDAFGQDRMIYTMKNRCIEDPNLPYEDGAATIYLYTKGTKGCPSKQLQEFLNYMENTCPANAVNDDLRDMQHMVDLVKQDMEVSTAYMRLMEDERILLARGEACGEKRGEARGIALGEKRGLERGLQSFVEACQELNLAQTDVIAKIIDKFQLSPADAEEVVAKYWK